MGVENICLGNSMCLERPEKDGVVFLNLMEHLARSSGNKNTPRQIEPEDVLVLVGLVRNLSFALGAASRHIYGVCKGSSNGKACEYEEYCQGKDDDGSCTLVTDNIVKTAYEEFFLQEEDV